ncbi:uncharacterized protein LY89DRAFT_714310, partial [Mollisia scopiformis]
MVLRMHSLKVVLLFFYSINFVSARREDFWEPEVVEYAASCTTSTLSCLQDKLASLKHHQTGFCAAYTAAVHTESKGIPPILGLCGTGVANFHERASSACSCFITKETAPPHAHITDYPAPPGTVWVAYEYKFLPKMPSLSMTWPVGPSFEGMDLLEYMSNCRDFTPNFEMHVLHDDGTEIQCMSFHY